MGITDFFSNHLGAQFANARWSWGATSPATGTIFLRVWADSIRTVNACEAVWLLNKRKDPSTLGAKERKQHVSAMQRGTPTFGVLCIAKTPIKDEKRSIASFDTRYLLELDGTTEDDANIYGKILGQVPVSLAVTPNRSLKGVFLTAEEAANTGPLIEGATVSVAASRYERSQEARRACIAHHGYSCSVCSMDFASVYGPELGDRYIHVHHRVPLSEIGESYVIDPIKDLVPVCPNCHAMIHRMADVGAIERLQRVVARHRSGLTQV